MKVATTALLPLLSALCLAQTKPLSVCDILSRPADWNNNVVLVRAHHGSGMEDSFLYDDRCPGREIWFDYPENAAQDDALVKDKLSNRRTPVTLQRDKKFSDFERYANLRDDKNPLCPALDLVITVRGRLDSKRGKPVTKNCPEPFGMCNYPARFVLESVQDVSIGHSKPRCK
jgi:hypothetical protein